ncbi:multiple epidermal growth factor-like domains protein 10 [Haliotis rufescens]|uniref:multiple epidermal growth factor-like domains protein 10 n=1 Tax=Haliotis rufescens TaxID=6454 RepID=UPI00201E8BAB|nr:multiple epidermal growth factor-like domains protein 10 [Haliotis rufescens]
MAAVDMELYQVFAVILCTQCIFIVDSTDNHCLVLSQSGACEECYIGWYGAYCDKMCQHCDTRGCSKTTGVCIQCETGYYSTNCSLTCPPQCRERYGDRGLCDRTTGKCREGCKPTWWGDKCEQKCGKQCSGSECFFYDGSCASGCKDGLSGSHCDKTCSVGCLHGNCSQLAGVCLHGCKTGFYGRSCDRHCTDKCHDSDCRTGVDGDTPLCTHGCVPGSKPPLCDNPCLTNCLSCTEAGVCTSCKAGFTGTSCEKKKCNCLGSGCSDDRICDGCLDGWQGQTCELACSQNCLRCQQKSGNCTTCRQGFTYDGRSQCTSVIPAATTKATTEGQESNLPVVIISIIVPLLVIVATGFCVLRCCRFRRCILPLSEEHERDDNAP